MTRAAAILGAVLLALAGCTADTPPAGRPSPTVDITPPQLTPATPTPAGQPTTLPQGLRDWIYAVGTEVAPGVYSTTVPADHPHPCYWARLRSFGKNDSVIDEGNLEPGVTVRVTVLATDKGFKVANGCTWTPVA